MNRIGFSEYSLSEMEAHWRGVELLHFFDCTKGSFVQPACCWYPSHGSNLSILSSALSAHFGTRATWDQTSRRFIVDELLCIGFFEQDLRSIGHGELLTVEVSPRKLKPWEAPEFKLAREIDEVLQKVPLPTLPKPCKSASFFRGKVLDDNPRFYEMEVDWKGVEILHFFDRDQWSQYARCWYESGTSTSAVLIDAINAHFGSRMKLVSANRYVIDDLLYLHLEQSKGFLELHLEPGQYKRWKEPESKLAREIDEVLQKVPVPTLPKPYKQASFFHGKVVE